MSSAFGFSFSRHVKGKIDDVVLIVTAAADQKLFALLQHADNAKLSASDLDRLADRRAEREEVVGDF